MNKVTVKINPKTLWTILAMVVGVYVAWHLRNFIMVVCVSVVIASFIEIGTQTFKKIHIPRIISVIFFYVLGFAILAGIFYLVVPIFTKELVEFAQLFPADSLIAKMVIPLQQSGLNLDVLSLLIGEGDVFQNSWDAFQNFQGVFGGLLNTILVFIISFYLAAQEKGVEQFLRVVTPEKYEEYVLDLWKRTERKIGYWFGGQMIVALFTGIVTYVGLLLLGVPYALILALIATVLEFLPFGTALATIPAVVLGYLAGGIPLALKIFILYVIIHYVESYFVSPYVLHRTVGMSMLVILLAVLACFELFGIAGLVIAIPLAVIILELIYDYGKLKKERIAAEAKMS